MFAEYGELYTFGRGSTGVLGHGEKCSENEPRLVEALSGVKVVDAACSNFHMAVVTSMSQSRTIVLVMGMGMLIVMVMVMITAMKMMMKMACVWSDNGELYTFGRNWMGQLGQSGFSTHISALSSPQKVASLRGHHIKSVACGRNHTLAVDGQ